MTTVSDRNFGLVIAYLVPGFVVLLAVADQVPLVASWLAVPSADAATVGGFLYATLASIAAGLLLSAVRWLILDSIHHATGVRPPVWNFAALQANFTAFDGAVQAHFRYYQFFGHLLIALVIAIIVHPGIQAAMMDWPTSAITAAGMMGLLFGASRDAMCKYYARTAAILNSLKQGDAAMTNGWHSKQPSESSKAKPKASGKATAKSQKPNRRGKKPAK